MTAEKATKLGHDQLSHVFFDMRLGTRLLIFNDLSTEILT